MISHGLGSERPHGVNMGPLKYMGYAGQNGRRQNLRYSMNTYYNNMFLRNKVIKKTETSNENFLNLTNIIINLIEIFPIIIFKNKGSFLAFMILKILM